MNNRLTDKVAIVTGAGSGLGKASAEMFAREGAAVVCADINEEAVTETVAGIEADGGQAAAIRTDLTQAADAEAMTSLALERFGKIDIVYACAGIAGAGTAADTSDELWDRVIAVNLTSKWLSFRYALPHMVEQGHGSIIVQASIGGVIGVPGIFPYAAAKGGCISMVKQAAVEYAPMNVRINGIAPGTIVTPLVVESYKGGGGMSAKFGVEEGLRRAHERYPLQRLGTPEDLAYMATYLASDEANWVTGQVLVLDGGITAA
jgi:NAD(P)-dependent dehydrogenase (short-subunit alcohol dehydrogenase family)